MKPHNFLCPCVYTHMFVQSRPQSSGKMMAHQSNTWQIFTRWVLVTNLVGHRFLETREQVSSHLKFQAYTLNCPLYFYHFVHIVVWGMLGMRVALKQKSFSYLKWKAVPNPWPIRVPRVYQNHVEEYGQQTTKMLSISL